MQIEIDFEVFKSLTARRENEADSYNAVIRRLLELDPPAAEFRKLIGEKSLWIGNVEFPHGTRFRATYKGKTYLAEAADGRWVDAEGNERNSPSDAAFQITHTNVNGWRFWHALRPGDTKWQRLDGFKS